MAHFIRLHVGWGTFTATYVNMDLIRSIKGSYEPERAGALLVPLGIDDPDDFLATRETPEEILLLLHGLPANIHGTTAAAPKPEQPQKREHPRAKAARQTGSASKRGGRTKGRKR
jgi:hypothetical protein